MCQRDALLPKGEAMDRPPIEEIKKNVIRDGGYGPATTIQLCDYALALEAEPHDFDLRIEYDHMVDKVRALEKEKAELEDKLKWACRKLAAIRANFGNALFTTNDLDLIISVIGSDEFIKYSKPSKKGKGVWS